MEYITVQLSKLLNGQTDWVYVVVYVLASYSCPLKQYECLIHPNNTFIYLVQCYSPIDCLHQARP